MTRLATLPAHAVRCCSALVSLGLALAPGTALASLILPDAQLALDANRALWSDAEVEVYEFTFQRGCFCVPEYTTPGRVRVSAGEIVGVVHPDDESALDPSLYLTLDQLFDEIQSAIDANAFDLRVVYDAHYGFPASISIDLVEDLADDETSYSASAFSVPEPDAPRLASLALISIAIVRRGARLASGQRRPEGRSGSYGEVSQRWHRVEGACLATAGVFQRAPGPNPALDAEPSPASGA